MRKPWVRGLILFIIVLWLPGQEKNLREEVTVVNVEVPVRVLLRGEAVDHLKKSDFILFENGKRREINGFHILRKRINRQDIILNSTVTKTHPPRFFVLVFNLVDYNTVLRKGVDSLFRNILRENDKLIVMANNKLLNFNSLNSRERIHEIITQTLKNEGFMAKQKIEGSIKDILNHSKFAYNPQFPKAAGELTLQLLNTMLRFLKEYRMNYLNADIGVYYNFAKFLEKVQMEKWVISFYQIQLFPRLSNTFSYNDITNIVGALQTSDSGEHNVLATMISRKLKKLTEYMNFDNSFPIDEVSKMFYKVNTTFHSIMIPTTIHHQKGSVLELKQIGTSLESTLRKITENTGGELLSTTDLSNALDEISEKTDIVYMLTYEPEDLNQAGEIEVNVTSGKFKVLYDNHHRADYITEFLANRARNERIIQIKSIRFANKRLSFKLSDFQPSDSRPEQGNIKVEIAIKSSSGKSIYRKGEILQASAGDINMEIQFDWLKKGQYDMTLDVTDMVSGKKAFEYIHFSIR